MKKINIAFGIHNHQPVGNFDFVFEHAYEKSYLPFLELLEKHPHIRLAQHYTGILFDWIKNHKPEFIPRLKKLVDSGQIEMMTGGFYEPILSVIPYKDKVGQIQKLNRFVKDETGYDAEGMWMAERIWEPQLPKPLSEAGVKYVVLDDSHFKSAGLTDEELLGYYVTEEEGKSVYLFPIYEELRYAIPFQPPGKTIDLLRSLATEDGQRLIVFADDGEKFGVWPNTFEHCYTNGWLESFFKLFEENSDWINLIHFSEAIEQIKPAGRIYLPTASYREMMEWAMPTSTIHKYENFEHTLDEKGLLEENKVFVRGGFWRNFMVKYPESNNMHKKMLHLSARLERLRADFLLDPKFVAAQDHIWAGQCNCPYWHGQFGGLYLNHLRHATYKEFVQAETLLDELEYRGTKNWIEATVVDFDADGFKEILVSTSEIWMQFSPQNGGSLVELDFKSKAINLLDTMTRREEAYHKKLLQAQGNNSDGHSSGDEGDIPSIHDMMVMKEQGLEKMLHYDWYRRTSMLDHFLHPDTTLESFSQSKYTEQGDFINAPYDHTVEDEGKKIKFSRQGHVWVESDWVRVQVEKEVTIFPETTKLKIDIAITNLDTQDRTFWYGSEWDFALLAGDAPDRYFVAPEHKFDDNKLRNMGEVSNLNQIGMRDEWLGIGIDLKVDEPATVWRFPIETISQSEAGFERVYQSSVILPNWEIECCAGETWRVSIEVDLKSI